MPTAIHPTLLARRDAIGELCREHGVVALDVFGSVADGRFDPERSDYDFIARFAPRDEPSLGRRFVAFSEALESLLGRPVDLMTGLPIDNPYLRQSVEATRRSVYVEPAAQTPA